jgi:nucleotide-binding universal stress UspA family protein
MADGLGLGYGQTAIVIDDPVDTQSLTAKLTRRLAAEGVLFDWIQSGATIELAISDNAGLSDIIVVSREGIEGSFEAFDLPALIAMKTSAPLLVVPPGQKQLDLSGPMMIAWDGSGPAQSAVRAAAPMAALASRVDIVSIGESKGTDAHTAARYLAAGDTLIVAMGDLGAQWAAAGCYGHSRLKQQIFGGVTRTLMSKAPIPLMIAH